MEDDDILSSAQISRETGIDPAVEDLKARLEEAEETIRAINQGEVDAVVVNSPIGPQVYALEGADHPYRLLVERMHEGTVTLDSDGLILYSNAQFAAMVGVAADSVAGLRFAQFLVGTNSNLLSTLIEAMMAQGHASGELNLRAVHGVAIPVRVSVAPLDAAGMQNLCILVSDLREQRRNQALVKEEQLSRLILEQAGEAIVVTDPKGIIVRRSDSANRLARGPVLMSPFERAFPLTEVQSPLAANRILDAVRSGEHVRGVEARTLHADGSNSALLVSVSPLWQEGNELLGCVITLTDISERKRVEEALARQAEELAMSNSDLRQFAFSASHDLREPLRHVAVFSELLQAKHQPRLDEEANQLIRHIVDSGHRMEGMLTDLMAYTTAANAPQESVGSVDGNEVLQRTLRMFETQVQESGARIDCEPLPVLQVHEVHLSQLFQNLIGNALKYRASEPPLIRIYAVRAKDMWEISVTDNGIGIHPNYQRQIFGLFQRLHGGGRYSGSGIGLAICLKIVQRYGGRIWVDSQPGCGSRFTFTLPGENNEFK